MNILKVDCGFNPKDFKKTISVTPTEIADTDGFNVGGYVNFKIEVAAGTSSDITITALNGLVDGQEYKFILVNDAATSVELVFPNTYADKKFGYAIADSTTAACTVTDATITNGDVIIYTLYVSGDDVFIKQEIF